MKTAIEKILLFSLLFWSSFAWSWMKKNDVPDWLFYWFLLNLVLLIIAIIISIFNNRQKR
jgi:hypothetical protein